jgi:hypothetical protein
LQIPVSALDLLDSTGHGFEPHCGFLCFLDGL